MKMFVTDLDGTLLMSDKNISARTLAMLEKLNTQGVKIVVATARPPRLSLKILPEHLNDVFVICYNGAEIYQKGKSVYRKCINAKTTKTIVDWFCSEYPKRKLSLEIDDHLFTNFDVSLMEWKTPYTQVDFTGFSHKETAKVLIDLSMMDDTSKVRNMLLHCCSIVITDGGALGQITHRDVSKLNAVKYLVDLFKCQLSDVVAFGDDFNDMDMIRECGVGVAMGNGEEALKKVADIIADTNDNDGVAKILEKIAG